MLEIQILDSHRDMWQEGRPSRVDDEPHAVQEPELGRAWADLGSRQQRPSCQAEGGLQRDAALGAHYAAHSNCQGCPPAFGVKLVLADLANAMQLAGKDVGRADRKLSVKPDPSRKR